MTQIKENKKFIDYVFDFYGKGGIYPIEGVSKVEITKMTHLLIEKEKIRERHGHGTFDGDTFDREIIRDMMYYNRGNYNSAYIGIVRLVMESRKDKLNRINSKLQSHQ